MTQSATGSNDLKEELNRAIARVQQAATVAQLERLITEHVDSDRVLFINKAFEVMLNRSENARLLYGRVRSILEQDYVIRMIATALWYEYSSSPLRTLEERERSLQVAAETLKRLETKYPGSVESLTARMIYDGFTWGGGKFKSVEEIGKAISPYYRKFQSVEPTNPHLIYFSLLVNRGDENSRIERYKKMIDHPEFDRYTLQQRDAAYTGLVQLLYNQKRTREIEFYTERYIKYLLTNKRIETTTFRSLLRSFALNLACFPDLRKRLEAAGYPPAQWRYKPLPKP